MSPSLLTIPVFLVVIFAPGRFTGNVTDVSPFSGGDHGVVHKQVFSNKLRLVFAAGIEGSGHHYLGASLNVAFKEHTELLPISLCNSSIVDPYRMNVSMSISPAHWVRSVSNARLHMKELARAEISSNELGAMATLQKFFSPVPCFGKHIGQLSYPNFNGKNKVLQYFDLRMLAEAAEAEGVDLRVVYLQRSAVDVLISTTVKRAFDEGDFMKYVRILLTDLAVIQSMLSEIGSEFVTCHDFSRLGDYGQAIRIAKHISPSPEMASMIVDSMVRITDIKGSEGAGYKKLGADQDLGLGDKWPLATRLQRKMDAINSIYCT